MALIKCRITQDYCYNNDYGNCHNCDIAKNNKTYLRPCPFCGGEAELITFYIKGVANRKNHFVRCKQNHFCRTRNYRRINDSIAAWNRRTGDELWTD